MRKIFLQLPKRAFALCVLSLAAYTLLSGGDEELALLQNDMEEEFPYLSQEDLEEQLKRCLNESLSYDGDIVYNSPLLSYIGTTLDYIVLHQALWDKKETENTQCIASIWLQPQEEALTTTMVDLTVCNESLYELSFLESLEKRVNLKDIVSAKEEIVDLLGLTAEPGEVKIWYQGTLTVGNEEKFTHCTVDK